MESVLSVLKAILVLPTKHKKDDETILEPVVNPSRSEVTLLLGNKFQESKSQSEIVQCQSKFLALKSPIDSTPESPSTV